MRRIKLNLSIDDARLILYSLADSQTEDRKSEYYKRNARICRKIIDQL